MNLYTISGSSGVGKTTFSYLLKNTLPDCYIINGDNFHKWERNNKKWQQFTHLNPESNNLNKILEIILNLKNNINPIYSPVYSHETGTFLDNKIISYHKNIIYEGLHALYDDNINKLSNLKIFIDTSDELKIEWKTKRDVKKRGYTKEDVLTIIEQRKQDEIKWIQPQKNKADIIIKFYKKNNIIDFEWINQTNIDDTIIKEVKKLYDSLLNLILISHKLSVDYSLVQGKGGNVSFKYDNKLIIKSSGFCLSDISFYEGYNICNRNNIKTTYNNETTYINDLKNSQITDIELLPSMETGFHAKLPHEIVAHCHPIDLNIILCSYESQKIINELFNSINYQYVKYVTPGFQLNNQININNKIFFLENHGVIVGGKTVEEVINTIEFINTTCKQWIFNNMEMFITSKNQTNKYLFPDSVILQKENEYINSHIQNVIDKCNLTPKYLTQTEIDELNSLLMEKMRK